MDSQYQYKPLVKPGDIRLLRVLPDNNAKAPIHCQLFEYELDGLIEREHIFEALSYCWGGSEKTHSITVDSLGLRVTSSLYTALLRLRNHCLDRILWIDAVCINQTDQQEKGHQIGLMGSIYSCANRVLVWLGDETHGSNQAIQMLSRIAGHQESTSVYEKYGQNIVLLLLNRDWFRRIWVLQEVAAARHIQILCGHSSLDGFAFCVAVDSLASGVARDESPWPAVLSVTYLMRGALSRIRYRESNETPKRIRPFQELVDMFRTHEASENRDKVYALLGMCSDDMRKSRLLPDYSVPFHELFKRVVEFTLSNNVDIETQGSKEVAVIKSKIYVLGTVHSVEDHLTASHEQTVEVSWKDISGSKNPSAHYLIPWKLQYSATPLQEGDIVCLLPNARSPTVIRPCKDFSVILILAAAIPPVILREGVGLGWTEARNRIYLPARDLVLIWDWHYSLEKYHGSATFARWARKTNWVTQTLGVVEAARDETIRIFNTSCIFLDSNRHEKARARFREGREKFEWALRVPPLRQELMKGDRAPPNDASTPSDDVRKIIKRKPIPSTSNDPVGEDPLIMNRLASEMFIEAVQRKALNVAELLLDSTRMDMSYEDSDGMTVLKQAARSGHVHLVKRLLRENANVNAAPLGRGGRTALQEAAGSGHLLVVEQLLRHNADVNAAASEVNGSTALQAAAGIGRLDIVERLLQANADVNAAAGHSNGRTALQAAAEGRHSEMVGRLLQEGADVHAPGAKIYGVTALEAARYCVESERQIRNAAGPRKYRKWKQGY